MDPESTIAESRNPEISIPRREIIDITLWKTAFCDYTFWSFYYRTIFTLCLNISWHFYVPAVLVYWFPYSVKRFSSHLFSGFPMFWAIFFWSPNAALTLGKWQHMLYLLPVTIHTIHWLSWFYFLSLYFLIALVQLKMAVLVVFWLVNIYQRIL